LTSGDSSGVSLVIDFIDDLSRRDIDDQLPELDRVARALDALGCLASNMARWPVSANLASTHHGLLLQSN
jgi:hypothetical protein